MSFAGSRAPLPRLVGAIVLVSLLHVGGGVALEGCGPSPSSKPRAPTASVDSTPATDPAALADLDAGERVVEVAAGDCAAACRGLDTMASARLRLCAPRTSACDDAERREDGARKKVVASCAPCPTDVEAAPTASGAPGAPGAPGGSGAPGAPR